MDQNGNIGCSNALGLRRGRQLAALAAVGLAAVGGAGAQPISSESFEYAPPGLNLPAYAQGGAGWLSAWDGNWQVAPGSLHYSSNGLTVASRGNKVRSTSAISQRTMSLEQPLGAAGTSVWVTMLGRQTAGAAANTFVGLRLPTGPSTFVYMGKPYGLANWGLDGGPGTTKLQSTVPATQESLLVMRIDFRAGADDVYLWVNPPLSAQGPSTATANIQAIGYNDFQNIPKVLMEMGSVGSTIEAELDEVRVGRSWADAMAMVPIAEFCVTPRSTGGCCYEFDLAQKTGTGQEFSRVVMNLPVGTTVSSATIGDMPVGSTVTYVSGGSTVQWDLPSGTTMNTTPASCLYNFKVSVCFNSVTAGVTAATFNCWGPNPSGPGYISSHFGPQNHLLNGPTCTYSQSTCCDTWVPTGFAGQPGAPINPAMVYDEGNEVTVLWGGKDCANGLHSALWIRRNNIWQQVTPIAGIPANGVPSARHEHAMAYDPVRKVVVMYGGASANLASVHGDVWELRFNGTSWVWDLKTPGVTPGPLFGHAMAYDPIGREVLVMGGLPSTASPGTRLCWGWNGTTFTPRASMANLAAYHAAALDESRQTIVAFNATGVEEYCNGVWTTSPAVSPPGLFRFDAAMAYDSSCGRIIIHGGWDFTSTSVLSDAWSYDGASFTSMSMPTRPQGRSQHCMSWDKRLQRVVMYGGYDPYLATCTDNTWHYDSGSSTVRHAGMSDAFSTVSVDPLPALAPVFLLNRPLLATAVFDQTVNNKTFGTSFVIPGWARGKITKAVLEFRARPLSGDASNDTFGISDFTRTGGGIWSTTFAYLPATGGNWNVGHAPTTFLLDLSALPVYSAGGVLQPNTYNMLVDLNTAGSWPDLFVQDDTAVDYARLHIWTCPRPKRWGGFDVRDIGAAVSSFSSGAGLQVSGFGASGGDGVEFDVGNAQGADLHWTTPSFGASPIGATMDMAAYGTVDGVAGTLVTRTHAVKTASDRTAFTCDAGTPTNTVELYSGGVLVAVVPDVPKDQPCYMIGNNWTTDWHCNDPAHILFVWSGPTFDNPALMMIGASSFANVDFVKFTPQGPVAPVTNVQSVVVTASGIEELMFDGVGARMFDATFQGIDAGVVQAESARINVGTDGEVHHNGSGSTRPKVKALFAASSHVSAEVVAFDESSDLSVIEANWDVLLASFTVSGGDLPASTSQSVAYMSDTGLPPGGEGNWSRLLENTSPDMVALIAHNGATVVATITPAEAPGVRVNRLPLRAGWMPAPSGGSGMFNEFAPGTKVYIPSIGLIDITSLIWDLGAGSAARVSELTIEAGDMTDPFTVTGLSVTAMCGADFDGDGAVDFFDYDAFVVCFEGGACPSGRTADFDGDGAVDFFDYDAFVVAFETGC